MLLAVWARPTCPGRYSTRTKTNSGGGSSSTRPPSRPRCPRAVARLFELGTRSAVQPVAYLTARLPVPLRPQASSPGEAAPSLLPQVQQGHHTRRADGLARATEHETNHGRHGHVSQSFA